MVGGWKEKERQSKTMPGCSSIGEETQLLNEENQVINCITNCLSRETVNIQRSICDTLPQRNVNPTICMSISVLPCEGSLANYEECIEAEVDDVIVENAFDGYCPKSLISISPSHQFLWFSTSTDN